MAPDKQQPLREKKENRKDGKYRRRDIYDDTSVVVRPLPLVSEFIPLYKNTLKIIINH